MQVLKKVKRKLLNTFQLNFSENYRDTAYDPFLSLPNLFNS